MSDPQRARELLAATYEGPELAHLREIVLTKPVDEFGQWFHHATRAIDQAIADERAAIVKWLRTEMPFLDHPLEYADAIESGEHSK